MSKKLKKDSNEIVKKLGEREEVIMHELTDAQLNEAKDNILCLLEDRSQLKAKVKEVASNLGAQAKTIDLQIDNLRETCKTGKRRETVTIEEHLTRGNQVVRIRKDTGKQLGTRQALAEELQEDLFPPRPEAAAPAQEDTEPGVEDPGFEVDADDAFSGASS